MRVQPRQLLAAVLAHYRVVCTVTKVWELHDSAALLVLCSAECARCHRCKHVMCWL
jgi:hypothetical protein